MIQELDNTNLYLPISLLLLLLAQTTEIGSTATSSMPLKKVFRQGRKHGKQGLGTKGEPRRTTQSSQHLQRPQPAPIQASASKTTEYLALLGRQTSPLAGPAHTYPQTLPQSQRKEEETFLPQPPTSPRPYLSPQAYQLFNFSLLLPKDQGVIYREPFGLNREAKYLDQTPNPFHFLELQDTINRSYGMAFDMVQITALARDAVERGKLVEVRPWVYQFDVEDQQEKMARYVKERARGRERER